MIHLKNSEIYVFKRCSKHFSQSIQLKAFSNKLFFPHEVIRFIRFGGRGRFPPQISIINHNNRWNEMWNPQIASGKQLDMDPVRSEFSQPKAIWNPFHNFCYFSCDPAKFSHSQGDFIVAKTTLVELSGTYTFNQLCSRKFNQTAQ